MFVESLNVDIWGGCKSRFLKSLKMELFWRASMGVQIVILESLNVRVLASLKRGSANRGFGEPQPTKYPPCSDASVLIGFGFVVWA